MHQDSDHRRSIHRAAFLLAAALLLVPAASAASTSTYSPTLGVNITTDRLTYSCNPSCQPQFNVTNFDSDINDTLDVTVFHNFSNDMGVNVTSIEEKVSGSWTAVGAKQGDNYFLNNHEFYWYNFTGPYQFRVTIEAAGNWSKWDILIDTNVTPSNVTLDPFINSISLHSPNNDTALNDPTPTFNYSFSSQNNSLNASVIVDNQLNPVYNWTNATSDTFYTVNATQSLSDGEHFWEVWVDSDGDNTRDSAERSENRTFTIDTVAPSVTPDFPSGTTVNKSGTFWVNATWSDATTGVENASYRLRFSNGTFADAWKPLNATLDSTRFADDTYKITYNATDFAGNTGLKNRTVTIDNDAPRISVLTPQDGAAVSDIVRVNATTTDATDVTLFQYRWVNSSDMWVNRSNVTGWRSLNDTFSTQNIDEGFYNLTFRANDTLGHLNASVNVSNVLVDNTKPNSTDDLNLSTNNYTGSVLGLSPLLSGSRIGSFSAAGLNWTGYDPSSELVDNRNNSVSSGVDHHGYALTLLAQNRSFNTSTQSLTGWGNWTTVNATINASASRPNITHTPLASNHQYRFRLSVSDRAGNDKVSNTVNLTLDTTPPVLADRPNGTVRVEPFQWTNQQSLQLVSKITDLAGVNATAGNQSTANAVNITFWNTSGKVHPSVSLNPSNGIATTLTVTSGTVSNLKNLTWYNVSIEATDALGTENTSINWSFRTDFNTPDFVGSVQVFENRVKHGAWNRDNVTVHIDCSDAAGESGMEAISTDTTGWLYSVPGNVSVTRNGNATETFECRDVAGNVNSSRSARIAIDAAEPSFSNEEPDDGGAVESTSPNLSVEYADAESGLNLSDGFNLSGSVDNIYNFTIEGTSVEDDAHWGNKLVWYDAGQYNGGDGLTKGNNYDVEVQVCDNVATGFDDNGHCESFDWEFDVAESTTKQTSTSSSKSGQGPQITSTLKIAEAPNTVKLPIRGFKTFNVTVKNNGSANLAGIETTFDVPNIGAAVTPADVNMDSGSSQEFRVNLTPTTDTTEGYFGGTLTAEADGGTSASTSINVSVVAPHPGIKIVEAPEELNVTRGNGTKFGVKLTNKGEATAEHVRFAYESGNLTSAVVTDSLNISVGETVFANVSVVATAGDKISAYRTTFTAIHPSGNRSQIIQVKVQPGSDKVRREIEKAMQQLEKRVNRLSRKNASAAEEVQYLVDQAKQALERGDYARAAMLQEQIRQRLPDDGSGGGGLPLLWIGLVILLIIAGIAAYLIIPEHGSGPYPSLSEITDRGGGGGGSGRGGGGYRSDYPGSEQGRGQDRQRERAQGEQRGADQDQRGGQSQQRGRRNQEYEYQYEEQSFGDKVRKTLASAREKGKQHKDRARKKVKRGQRERQGRPEPGEQRDRSRQQGQRGQGGSRGRVEQGREGSSGERRGDLEHDSEPRVTKKKIRFEDEE